mmetsp:Transcript_12597/g.43940  ORF Transcript_12597/g.43940 Transcript_12597/m.43940 type:complete len:369 (-) Transcript_12597:220-1326(-)
MSILSFPLLERSATSPWTLMDGRSCSRARPWHLWSRSSRQRMRTAKMRSSHDVLPSSPSENVLLIARLLSSCATSAPLASCCRSWTLTGSSLDRSPLLPSRRRIHLLSLPSDRHSQAAEDAVERLLQKSQSAKLWLRGEVDFEDRTSDGWFDMGVGRPYTSLTDLQKETINTNREVLLADASQDNRLKQLVEEVKGECASLGLTQIILDKRDIASTDIKKKCVVKIAEILSQRLGGSILYDKYMDFGYSTEIQRCKQLRKSNVVWVGDLKKAGCRHRAFLFKYLCDLVLPYLCRLERTKIERGAHVGHAWNVVKFFGDVDQEGQQKTYTVDLMHNVGSLYENGTDFNPADEWAAKYQRKDVYHFISLG